MAFFIVSWIVISFASCINYAFFSYIPQLCFASTPLLLYIFTSRFTHGLSNFPLFLLRFKKAFSSIFGYFITILYCIFPPFFLFFLILFCLFFIVTSFHQVICDFLFLCFLAPPPCHSKNSSTFCRYIFFSVRPFFFVPTNYSEHFEEPS